MSQKRHQEEGKARSEGTSNPEDKRRRNTFQNVGSETMKSHTVQDSEEQIHKVVGEEVKLALTKLVGEEVKLALRKHVGEEVKLALRKHVGEEVKLALRKHVGEEVKLALRKHVGEEVKLALRKHVREEVELAPRKPFNNMKQNCEEETQPSESRILELQFRNKLSLPVFTGAWIEGEKSSRIQVALVDCVTEQIVKSGPESSAKVEIVVLEGNFDGVEDGYWTPEEFKNNIVKEREGKKLLRGKAVLNLYEGVGYVDKIYFADNSSWTRCRSFRLGARVVDSFDGTRVQEAKTESFTVKEQRGELYKKHHPPALLDEVWRLEKIGKDGAFHKRLTRENICTVKDFLTLLFVNPPRLRHILGTGMSTKMWEVTVEHAQTCILDKRIHLYCSPGSQQRTGVVFNDVGQVMYQLLECEYIPVSKLSDTQKVDAQNLVLSAFEQWGEVVSFDDDASLLGGGSSNVATVGQTSSSPRGEDFSGSKFMATQKIGGFEYTQPPASSRDIISSIYSVGGTSGLDDYALHNIDGMGLRYDQTLTFPGQVANSLICDPDSIAHAFCDDDHLQFFDTDLQSQNILPESPADLQSAVDGFLLTQRSTAAVAAIDKAQRRWTKLSSVLKWFLVRRSVRFGCYDTWPNIFI